MQSSFTHRDTLVSAMPDWGIISVSGPDAVDYLQGKLTIDLVKQSQDVAQIGCHCDFKGKTWSVFYALKDDQQIDLLLPRSCLQGSLDELKKYGVFSKADFVDASDQWQIFVGQGKEFIDHMKSLFAEVPVEPYQKINREFGSLICFDAEKHRYMCLVNRSAAMELEEDLAEFFTSPQWWEQAEIQAGVAMIYAQTVGEFVPQMMNLQRLDAISFDKGCYMGQEVVARTKYLGKNKRAAFILSSNRSVHASPGDLLEKQVGDNWRRAGTILRASDYKQQSYLLAVLPNDTQSGDVLRLKDQVDAQFSVQDLPYTLD